jgi:DNA-binding transcriptional MerR regulator
LRKWETRYGFPKPQRTESGRREYSAETVEQLLSIRRQMASGKRAGKVLSEFLSCRLQTAGKVVSPELDEGFSRLLGSDVSGLRQWFRERCNEMTAVEFVEQVAAPMARKIGSLWASGELPVFAEHLFSEELPGALSFWTATSAARSSPPRILLTAPAGERHSLGLRMAQVGCSLRRQESILFTFLQTFPTMKLSLRQTTIMLAWSASLPARITLPNCYSQRSRKSVSNFPHPSGFGSAALDRRDCPGFPMAQPR